MIIQPLFQSTLPRRERRHARDIYAPTSPISIHAPAKGATVILCQECSHLSISIHAPAKGATSQALPAASSSRFQSTLPRRERLSVLFSCMSLVDFNPRSREGSDALDIRFRSGKKLFQSTLPRRERPCNAAIIVITMLFQSTLPRRERQ